MITTIHGNMLEIIQKIADESIDLLLTDPPYNISSVGANPIWKDPKTGKNLNTIHNQKFSENFDQKWDEISHEEFILQLQSWANVWYPKIRKGGAFLIFISDKYISYLWRSLELVGFKPKRVWTWKKPAAVPFNRSVNPVSACEYILFGVKAGGKRTFNSNSPEGSLVERNAIADKASSILYKMIKDAAPSQNLNSIFDAAKIELKKIIDSRKVSSGLVGCVIPNTIIYSGGSTKERIHPTEKPVELLEYFIELLSNKGDIILDTFAGSGSTGVAANNKRRSAILIEQDLKMFKKMKNKIDQIVKFEEIIEDNSLTSLNQEIKNQGINLFFDKKY